MSEREPPNKRRDDLMFDIGFYLVLGAITLGGAARVGINAYRYHVCSSAMQFGRVEEISPQYRTTENPRTEYNNNRNLNE